MSLSNVAITLWQAQGASPSELREQSNIDMNGRTAITYFQTSLAESHCDTHRTIVLQPRKQTNQPYFKEMTISQTSGKSSKRNTSGDFNHISLLHFSLLREFSPALTVMLSHRSRMNSFCGHHSPAINATSTAVLTVTRGDNQFRGGPSTHPDLAGLISVEHLTQEKTRVDIPTAATTMRREKWGGE